MRRLMKLPVMGAALLAASFFTGCTRKVYVPVEGETVIETRYIERVDTVTVTVPVPAQSVENVTADTTSHLETDVARSDCWLDSLGRLHHTLENKPVELPAQVPVKSYERDSIVYRDRPVPYSVERGLTRWEQTKMDFGGFALGAVAVGLVTAGVSLWRRRK